VITGFNTDIEHDGVVYHVQTEDKGLETPIILSLVYSGGAILASKRSPYKDLIAEGFSDEALAERLKRQHKLICAAIHGGRIEDLKRMASRGTGPLNVQDTHTGSHAGTHTGIMAPEIVTGIIEPEIVPGMMADQVTTKPVTERVEEHDEEPETVTGVMEPEIVTGIMADQVTTEPVTERDEEPETVTGVMEPEIVTGIMADQVTTEPVTERYEEYSAETEQEFERRDEPEEIEEEPLEPIYQDEVVEEGLALTLINDQEFRSGDEPTLTVFVSDRASRNERPLNNASVSIKILGTTFRPLIYSLKTQKDGTATVTTQIPHFTSGRAAVLVRAVAKGKAAELRRVIHPSR